METPEDAVPESLELAFAILPSEDESDPSAAFQEINARRAQVENAELLHHLRGL
jgi:hypothetical protein